MIFYNPFSGIIASTLLLNAKIELEKMRLIHEEENRDEYPYTSFDCQTKVCYLGGHFLKSIEIEKQIIKSMPIYKEIVTECKKITNKKEVLEELNSWKLPDSIFKLMPEWWQNNGNDIQGMSPSVTAIHRIIQEQLK